VDEHLSETTDASVMNAVDTGAMCAGNDGVLRERVEENASIVRGPGDELKLSL